MDRCLDMIRRAQSHAVDANASSESLAVWVHALNQMALLDRDIPWLDSSSSAADGPDLTSSYWPLVADLGPCFLLDFVRSLGALFHNCSNAILKAAHSSEASAAASDGYMSTAGIMRHAECAGEIMRVLNLAMKSRRNACVAATSSGKLWTSVIDPFMQSAVDAMKSDLLSKASEVYLRLFENGSF